MKNDIPLTPLGTVVALGIWMLIGLGIWVGLFHFTGCS